MEDFIFHDFDKKSCSKGSHIAPNTIRIHSKVGNRTMAINTDISDCLVKRGFFRLRIREDPFTGALALIFNAEKGRESQKTTFEDGRTRPMLFASKDMVEFLIEKLEIKRNEVGAYDLKIRHLNTTEKAAVYEIIKPTTIN